MLLLCIDHSAFEFCILKNDILVLLTNYLIEECNVILKTNSNIFINNLIESVYPRLIEKNMTEEQWKHFIDNLNKHMK